MGFCRSYFVFYSDTLLLILLTCLWQFSFDLRFDRDWKKIEDFVGSKTVIQV